MTAKSDKTPIRLCSLHWGLSLGGVSTYAGILEEIQSHVPVRIDSVCVQGRNWFYDEAVGRKIKPKIIPIRDRWDLGWLNRVASHIGRNPPQVIMTHGFNGHFVVWAVCKKSGFEVPVICSYHGPYHSPSLQRRPMERLFNGFNVYFLRRHASAIVTVAEYCKQHLVKRGVAADKICVVHNGIEDVAAENGVGQDLREQWGVAPNEILIGVASRLDPVKGLSYLITAAVDLVKEFPNVKLLIIGTGILEDSLRLLAQSKGIAQNCIFSGYRRDIGACLAAMDIFALPSLAESHSIALLEAMRAGKAIVATDVGGNTESLRPPNEALVVPPGNSQALHTALRELVLKPKFKCQLAMNARERFLRDFTMDKMVSKTAKWFADSCRKIKINSEIDRG